MGSSSHGQVSAPFSFNGTVGAHGHQIDREILQQERPHKKGPDPILRRREAEQSRTGEINDDDDSNLKARSVEKKSSSSSGNGRNVTLSLVCVWFYWIKLFFFHWASRWILLGFPGSKCVLWGSCFPGAVGVK